MKPLLILTLLLSGASIQAQIIEGGIQYQSLKATGKSILSYDPGTFVGNTIYFQDVDETAGMVGIYGGYYHPFYKFMNDKLSLGINSQARFLIWFEPKGEETYITAQVSSVSASNSGGSTEMQLLVLPALRFGELSSSENIDFGASLEIGVRLNTFSYQIFGLSEKEKGSTFKPLIKIAVSKNDFVFGLDFVMSSYQAYYRGNVADIPRVKISNQISGTLGFLF